MTTKGEATKARQAGDYRVPIIEKPAKKPIPAWDGGPDGDTAPSQVEAADDAGYTEPTLF